ncbi:MAG: pantetheine-phosphate adenylyltransferase [Clostridia bacterium]|nr:pantetheine-phosphate adenylyltransferase [Clostridia bacterium]
MFIKTADKKPNKCVYAGSFDPPHLGHADIIGRCNMLFDGVIVAVGVNESKKYRYPLGKRLEMLEKICAKYENVTVTSFDGLLVDFLREKGIVYYVRGVRDENDYEYEKRSFDFNVSKMNDIETIFLDCSSEYKNVSSTRVKRLLDEKKSVDKLVPPEIIPLL